MTNLRIQNRSTLAQAKAISAALDTSFIITKWRAQIHKTNKFFSSVNLFYPKLLNVSSIDINSCLKKILLQILTYRSSWTPRVTIHTILPEPCLLFSSLTNVVSKNMES